MTGTEPLRCPALACGGTLRSESAHGVTVDRCDRCGGMWFDAHELDRWLADYYPDLPQPPEHRIPRRGVGGRPCPRCHKPMDTAGWTGLVLDRCPECHGIFAEAPELSTMEHESLPDGAPFARQLKEFCVSSGWSLLAARAIAVLLIRFLA